MIEAAERLCRLQRMVRDIASLMDRLHYLRMVSPANEHKWIDRAYQTLLRAGCELKANFSWIPLDKRAPPADNTFDEKSIIGEKGESV